MKAPPVPNGKKKNQLVSNKRQNKVTKITAQHKREPQNKNVKIINTLTQIVARSNSFKTKKNYQFAVRKFKYHVIHSVANKYL